jgi:hypothetical protein
MITENSYFCSEVQTGSLNQGKTRMGRKRFFLDFFTFKHVTLLHLPPSDSVVSEDDGIAPWTVATLALKPDLIHTRMRTRKNSLLHFLLNVKIVRKEKSLDPIFLNNFTLLRICCTKYIGTFFLAGCI